MLPNKTNLRGHGSSVVLGSLRLNTLVEHDDSRIYTCMSCTCMSEKRSKNEHRTSDSDEAQKEVTLQRSGAQSISFRI